MNLTLVFGAVTVGLVLLGWRLSLRSAARDQPMVGAGPQRHPFHCVVVETKGGGCAASRRLAGQRFLASQAPQLPLSGCSQANCNCVYQHFEDRRHHTRRDPYVHKLDLPVVESSQDRRLHSGRRRTDLQIHPVH